MGKFILHRTADGVKFTLRAGNGQVVVTSVPYFSGPECIIGIRVMKRICPGAYIEDQTAETYAAEKNPKFEIFLDEEKEFRFCLKDETGDILLTSGAYGTKASCMNGIECLRRNAPYASIVEERRGC